MLLQVCVTDFFCGTEDILMNGERWLSDLHYMDKIIIYCIHIRCIYKIL